MLHDGKTLLAPAAAHVQTLADLAGRKVCFLAETETEVALQDWSRAHGTAFVPFPFQEEGEMEAAFVTGNCAAVAGDATRLGDLRASPFRSSRAGPDRAASAGMRTDGQEGE